jgi:serine phosphatase RsbU (regulator of sigma subunit)
MKKRARAELPAPDLRPGPLVPAASIAYAIAVAVSLVVGSLPAARLIRIAACAVAAFTLVRESGRGRDRFKVGGWAAIVFAAGWANSSAGAPSGGVYALALVLGVLLQRPLAPWVRARRSGWLALLALAAVAPFFFHWGAGGTAVAPGMGMVARAAAAAARQSGLVRLDRALYTLVAAWVFLAGVRAVGELLRRWIRRARVRTKLLVAFAIFAITPAALAFAYAVLAGWIHAGSLRASVIDGQLEATSGGRGVIERAQRDPPPQSGADLAARIERERPVLEDRRLLAVAWERGAGGWREAARYGGPDSLFRPAVAPMADSGEVVRGLACRGGRFWWVETALWPRGGDTLALQTFEAVDTTRMSGLARNLRCDALLVTSSTMSPGGTTLSITAGPPKVVRTRNVRHFRAAGGAVEVGSDTPEIEVLSDSATTALERLGGLAIVGGGGYARAKSLHDFRGPTNGGATPRCYLWTGSGWRSGVALLLIHSSGSEAFHYSGLDLGPFTTATRLMLILFAVLFLGVELVSLVVGSRVARYITRGAASLRAAAVSIGKGEFSARVTVPSEDELGELADSFNRMAEGLEEGQRAVIEREQMRRELELARRIQSRLLPPGPPSLPRLDIAAANAMSQQVGGDYYDFISLEDGRVGFCIADVAGKGVAAALLMSSVKTALVSSAAVETAPDRLTTRVNRLLEQSIEPGRFVTFFLATLDPATLRLDYVNAGHPAPMLLRATGGTERLEMGGLILGIDASAIFQSGSVTLAPGDLLALFTDGVTEAQGAGEELFGDERIEATLRLNRERRSEEVLNALIAAVKEYEGERGPSDDLTAIVVKVEVGA